MIRTPLGRLEALAPGALRLGAATHRATLGARLGARLGALVGALLLGACASGPQAGPLVDTLLRVEAGEHLQCEGSTLNVSEGAAVTDVQGNYANYVVSGCNQSEMFTCGQFCRAEAISCMPADMVILFHCPER